MKYLSIFCLLGIILISSACKKASPTNKPANTPTDTVAKSITITPPTTVPVANSIGFFLDDWQAKTFTVPSSVNTSKPTVSNPILVTVDYSATLTKIPKYLFGNNTNPYMGQYVTEPNLMSSITKLNPNILRFPGGSLSDVYFWNLQPGNKPSDAPDTLLDNNGIASPAYYWYGNNTANWTFSLSNYYSVLQQTGSTGIITINYGYARYGTGPNPVQTAAHLAANWVRYDKGRTKFWEIGNECYGNWEAGYRIDTRHNKDGQPSIMSGALYGSHFKVFADSMRKAALEVGAKIKIGGILFESATGYDATQSQWDSGFLSSSGSLPDYFIAHNYYTPYLQNSDPSTILNTALTSTQTLINYYKSLSQTYNFPVKPLALTEWNINAEGSLQKVSNIAGLHATLVLGELIKNQYGEASRWDMANGWNNGNDHGLFNIGDEPNAPKWNARPAYYYMYFFQKMMGDRMVSSNVSGSSTLMAYASGFSSGEAGITLVNTSPGAQMVNVQINNFNSGTAYYYYTLNGGTDNGNFSRLVYINGKTSTGVSGGPANFDAIPANSSNQQGGINIMVPGFGAVFLVAAGK